MFLDASTEELLLRYKFTRRHHPMLLSSMANTLEEAIEVERDMFNALMERAFLAYRYNKVRSAWFKKCSDGKIIIKQQTKSFPFPLCPLDLNMVYQWMLI